MKNNGNHSPEDTIMNNMDTSGETEAATANVASVEAGSNGDNIVIVDKTENQHQRALTSATASTIVNTASVLVVAVVALVLRSDIISVSERGVFCDDLSIRYPIRKQTVSTKLLIIVTTLIAFAIFSVVEYFSLKLQGLPSMLYLSIPGTRSSRSLPMLSWLASSLKLLIMFFMGAGANSIFTDICKSVLGWPRPNFWETCQPDVECHGDVNAVKYHVDFTCKSGISAEELDDARKSFPSGHASFAAFGALFLVLYLHKRLSTPTFPVCIVTSVRPLIQLILLASAWWSAITRVTDYVHHPIDVVAGLVLGAIVALWSFSHLLAFFQRSNEQSQKYIVN